MLLRSPPQTPLHNTGSHYQTRTTIEALCEIVQGNTSLLEVSWYKI